jgi:hypothetical protein
MSLNKQKLCFTQREQRTRIKECSKFDKADLEPSRKVGDCPIRDMHNEVYGAILCL